MQTYSFEQNQANLSEIIQKQSNEPLILKNASGMNYLVMPFSQDKWQEVFLMLYKSFTEIETTINIVPQNETKKMTALEFVEKWGGILNESDVMRFSK